MSLMRKSDPADRRLTRRGFVGGMLLLSASAAIACGGGTAAPAGGAAAPAGPTAVKMTDANKFDPAAITIAKGATVTWTNGSTMVHSVTDDPAKAAVKADAQLPDGAQAWDSSLIQPGATYSHTFDVVGTYKYFCIPHESLGMLGTVTVQ